MKNGIKKAIEESSSVKSSLLSEKGLGLIEKIAKTIIDALKKGGKVLVFGNGGSAADSQHMVAELVGRFKKERKAIPAIALTTNTSSLTALSNDYGYEVSFKRQIEALGKKGDVAVAISTSGSAKNVTQAVGLAREMGLSTIALTGKNGGNLKSVSELAFIVESNDTPRIQEAHILIIHILCELIENSLTK
ncbi:MAG: D-sedoheptulose 7-phosphate isomerase [Candidatus Omnitrophica bacterium]|nr:D-sedoheptulose 7-phosphate isomerase [Candidatus Omnitrophota bacterium]